MKYGKMIFFIGAIAVIYAFLNAPNSLNNITANLSEKLDEFSNQSEQLVNESRNEKELTEQKEKLPKYIETNYSWSYNSSEWSYYLKIPKSAYDYYKTVDRNKISNYSYYVTDTTDDKSMAALADEFKKTAKEENYSDYDSVNNIICFVQSLNYVSDKVGTGYDEYPKFPLETLADEGGDCEDSAILLASLLRELGYDTVLIQLENHMAVGVKGSENIEGVYYEVDGKKYFYIETTSPGWKIGDVPDEIKDQSAKILSL